MAWTTADRDTLKTAIATGATRVAYPDGSEINYRSLGQMRQTLELINREIAGDTVKRTKVLRIQSGSGLR